MAELHSEKPTNYDLYGSADAVLQMEDGDDDTYNAWVVNFWANRSLHELLAESEHAQQSMLHGKSLLQVLPNQSFERYAMNMPAIRAWLRKQG